MQKEKSLKTEHPDFKDVKGKYKEWRAFCEGGPAVEGRKEYLKQHAYESGVQYNIRLWLSTYRNYAKPIVDVFSSSIWRATPDRSELNKDLAQYLENVDRMGTDADTFFQRGSRDTSKAGVGFVLVDYTTLPKEDRNRRLTAGDAKKLNLRPFFKFIRAEQVIDWGINKNPLTGAETLVYVVFKEEVEIDAVPFEGHEIETQYNLWTTDQWQIWTEDDKNNAHMIDSGNHPCRAVPIVPCFFIKLSHMTGESAIADVVSLCKRTYRLGSCLDKSLYDTGFPLQMFLGFTQEEIASFKRSSSTGLVSQDTQADSKFVEPNGRSFAELKDSIKEDEKAIREIALRMVRADSQAAQSAESKRIDKEQLNGRLAVFAGNVELCENTCWEFAARWLGKGGADTGDVAYNKDFDEDQISSELIRAFIDLHREDIIPRDDVIDMLIKHDLLPDDYDKKDAMLKILNQGRTDPDYPGPKDMDRGPDDNPLDGKE